MNPQQISPFLSNPVPVSCRSLASPEKAEQNSGMTLLLSFNPVLKKNEKKVRVGKEFGLF
jgi:hypothetical protein